MNYKERLDSLKEYYLSEKKEKEITLEAKEKLDQEINSLDEKQSRLMFEKEIVIRASEEARKAGKEMIENLSTAALQEINPNLSIKVVDGIKYSTPSVDISLVNKIDNGEIIDTDPVSEDAGGLSDLVSLSCLLSLNIIDKENKAPIFLDEPTKFVSKSNSESTAEFLRAVADDDKNKKQIFVLTHERDFLPEYADSHYFLEKDYNGDTKILKV